MPPSPAPPSAGGPGPLMGEGQDDCYQHPRPVFFDSAEGTEEVRKLLAEAKSKKDAEELLADERHAWDLYAASLMPFTMRYAGHASETQSEREQIAAQEAAVLSDALLSERRKRWGGK